MKTIEFTKCRPSKNKEFDTEVKKIINDFSELYLKYVIAKNPKNPRTRYKILWKGNGYNFSLTAAKIEWWNLIDNFHFYWMKFFSKK